MPARSRRPPGRIRLLLPARAAVVAAGRRALPVVGAAAAVVGLAALFAGPLGEASTVHQRAVAEQAENDALQARIAAGEREIALLADRTYLDQLARGWGLGLERERGFALEPGAPPPDEIRPVGEDLTRSAGDGVVGDLVRTVFGG